MKKCILLVLLVLVFNCNVFAAGFTHIAGGGLDTIPDVGDIATDVQFDAYGSKVDANGNLYIATYPNASNQPGFVRVNRSGIIDRVFLDTVNLGEYFDDLDVDRDGNVYLLYDNRMMRVDVNDNLTEVASGYTRVDCLSVNAAGDILAAGYHSPDYWKIDPVAKTKTLIYTDPASDFSSYACDSDGAGNVYASNSSNNSNFTLYRVSSAGVSTPIHVFTEVINGIGVDDWGNVYFTDIDPSSLTRIDPLGNVTSFGATPLTSYSYSDPARVSVDEEGMVYVNVYASEYSEVHKYTLDPEIYRIFPEDVSVGGTLTIEGRYFLKNGTGGSVTIDGLSAEVSSWSNETISVVIPAGAKAASDVIVTTKDSNATAPYSYRVK
ncbi:MAG: IPT/TIG domain-containing protein [Desulfuromonadales bacterium]|nr:IPT/TIG domain-containing protein [Desulfuromonadales bacterium]